LGVLLATWVRRLGRAVALSVIAFFLSGIGWIFVVEFSSSILSEVLINKPPDWLEQRRWVIDCIDALSPVGCPFAPFGMLRGYSSGSLQWRWAGLGLVVAIKAATAALLLWLTVEIFDRCLGRIPESGLRAHRLGRPRALKAGLADVHLDVDPSRLKP